MKPKFEAQDAHFSGKQYTLHCSIVEPNDPKYVYHLCDDTTHDPSFVHLVLEDIFEVRGFKDTHVMIKSDNAPTQYKNRFAFKSLQQLADKYNCTIIRIYGAAGQGKGLIDAMSSFGVKSILRRDITAFDKWFANSAEIVDYLTLRGDNRMMYTHIDEKYVDSVRQAREEREIRGCMKGHVFIYKPHERDVLMREYLCACDNCLKLDYERCFSFESDSYAISSVSDEIDEEECELDDECINNADEDQALHRFEFIELPSYVALVSGKISKPLYIIKVAEKGKATEKMYLKGNYLVKTSSKSSKKKAIQGSR